MPDKLAQLRKLLGNGYSVVHVDSDDVCVETRLQRGSQFVTVRLHRSDAQRLLFDHDLRRYR